MPDPAVDATAPVTRAADPPLSPAIAERVLADQPFSRLLGARLTGFGDGAAVLELSVRPELTQQNGHVHGGVLAYAADNAVTFAGGSVLGPAVLTGSLTLDYLAPARGRTLRARASVVHTTGRRAVCHCEVLSVDDAGATTPVAIAQGTVVAVRPAPPRPGGAADRAATP
ncbi:MULTISPECIES: PaaI family thioesterase [unclassified Blastococcus]